MLLDLFINYFQNEFFFSFLSLPSLGNEEIGPDPQIVCSSRLKMFTDMFANLQRMRARQILLQVISFGLIVSSALMIWKTLMVVTGSESPIVVVLRCPLTPAATDPAARLCLFVCVRVFCC
jgi:hypothetical protein